MDALSLSIGFLVGAIVAGVVAWLLATARARAAHIDATRELETRLAAETRGNEDLRARLEASAAELADRAEQLARAQQARVAAETSLTESQKSIVEQRRLLEEAEKKLRDVFTALSTQALRANSEQFLNQAGERVKPLAEMLDRFDKRLAELEKARQTAYGSLTEQLQHLAKTHQELARQTTSLSTALRSPDVKGRWGEVTLRNAVELAGLSRYCDFTEQSSITTDAGRSRPDLVVNLPGNRQIIVDAKAPVSDYIDALAAETEDERARLLARHASRVREHLRQLSAKSYWSQFEQTPEFVVMFVPGESFFAAALEQDRDLIQTGVQQRVILASPTTLIALLRAVATSWQQAELVENARQIGQIAAELHARISKFGEHLANVGKNLGRTTDAFNQTVGSFETRVLPLHAKVAELGVRTADKKELELRQVDLAPRVLRGE